MRRWTLGPVLLLLAAMPTGARAQLNFGGCVDAAGRPVPHAPNPQLNDIAMATLAPDGSPIIIYNPYVVQQNQGPVARFFYMHECAHHALGQVLRQAGGQVNPIPFANEQEADCAAIVTLVRSGEFSDAEVTFVQRRLSGSPGDFTHLPGPVRATNLRGCLQSAGVSGPVSSGPGEDPGDDDGATYTARFRMWSRAQGNPTTFDLVIDDDAMESMSNLDGDDPVEFDLAPGTHTFTMTDITVYGPYGVIASDLECSGSFRVTRDRSFNLWARLSPSGEVRCGVQ